MDKIIETIPLRVYTDKHKRNSGTKINYINWQTRERQHLAGKRRRAA